MIELDKNKIPTHIAIIMDGNGRWAMERGQERPFGHRAGLETVHRITEECVNLGVKYLTLYTFSTENWNRPEYEVAMLMDLIITSFEEELFVKNHVRFTVIGDVKRLPPLVQERVQQLIDHTAHFTRMTVAVALSYSSRWEITEMVKQLAQKAKDGELDPATITEQTITESLSTNYMPDPDLLIRTGGELRISNFLMWQISYSELYFCDTYWPAFMEEDLHKAILSFQQRQRRFGKTEAQVEEE